MRKTDSSSECTRREAAIIAASRLVKDGDAVFVGQGLPVIVALYAKRHHAPNCVIMHEYGVVDTDPPVAVELAHPLFAEKATYLCDMIDALACLLHHVDIAILGAAQIDRYGNVNTTTIGEYFAPKVRISGSGGANDIGSIAPRLALVMDRQSEGKFPKRVDYLTTPGNFYGSRKRRKELNLPGGGVEDVVTDVGIYRASRQTGELVLESLYDGVDLDEARRKTGWKLRSAKEIGSIPTPSREEVELLRALDPRLVYLR
ncbi:MAG: CoA-transferase subunit beta [Thaumarchaeota archaeon]|nr:CoA-transferase subunit beta [Nitrososphaerota archaeon]MCL5068289.1 CoA-transferase subunit beta [Nitrososphaerota archaeon]